MSDDSDKTPARRVNSAARRAESLSGAPEYRKLTGSESLTMQDSLFKAESGDSPESLAEINEELLRRAKALPQFKERVLIFGEGGRGAKAAVVGESPGPPDIDSGRPFMGPAGLMLERILSSIGLARSDCYLTNVVKAISQGDEITPEWLSFFTPYLHRELAAA